MDDLTDFLENGLYDPAFVTYDPSSTTQTFQPNQADLAFSTNRPDLAALGARDGQLLSGRAIDDDDALSRRDQGLEFLDVTRRVDRQLIGRDESGFKAEHVWRFTNTSSEVVDTHLLVIVRGLPAGVELRNATGTTKSGEPYVRVFLRDGVLNPGQFIVQPLVFGRPGKARPPAYTIALWSGQGTP